MQAVTLTDGVCALYISLLGRMVVRKIDSLPDVDFIWQKEKLSTSIAFAAAGYQHNVAIATSRLASLLDASTTAGCYI